MPATWRYMMIVLVACLIASMVIAHRDAQLTRRGHRLARDGHRRDASPGRSTPPSSATTLIHEHLPNPRRGGPRAVAAGQGRPAGSRSASSPATARRRRSRSAAPRVELGVKTIVDPTAMFLGRDVGVHARVSERDRPPGRPLHRDLHLRPPAALLRQPRPRPDRRPVRRRHRAGDPGHRDQGRVHQVRRRRAGGDRERREGPPCGGPGQRCAPGRRSWPTRARRARPRPRQIEIFLEEGVEPAKIQIAHTGDTDDLDYIERVLETGVWIGLDRYGLEMYLPYEQRHATTLALLERGYADRDLPVRRLLRDDRLVRAGGGRADARRRDGQGLGHQDGPDPGDPGPARPTG